MKLDLKDLADELFSAAQRGNLAVVFDLDSTLFSVGPRTEHILRQLGQSAEFVSRFGELSRKLQTLSVGPRDYSVRQILTRLDPAVVSSAELVELVRTYWREHFFASHHLDKDELYPFAREFVEQLHGWGAKILYLTGRPQKSMREGTESALKRAGFPAFSDEDLLMKPEESETDEHFKVTELRRLESLFAEIWFFENEPLIIQDVRLMVPKVKIVFVDSVHAGQAPAPRDLISIEPDFRLGLLSKGQKKTPAP